MTDFSKEFDFARSSLLNASEIPLSFISRDITSTRKADNSIVTEADIKTEEFLRSNLETAFPTYGFLGEEGKIDLKDIFWIIDPIDGTTAFAHGLPEFTMVLGLVVENSVRFSLFYNPITEALYHAKKGEGAYKNNEQIHVSNVETLKDAYVSLNKGNFQNADYETYTNTLVKKCTFRVAPSAGVESGYLAEGKIDVLVKFNQAIWDVAPECLLMEEAGAVITNEFGNPLTLQFSKEAKHNYLAMNPEIFKNDSHTLFFPK
jgi:myo-inositol-1(or 4)-monophosphatase